jgi:hypothetical protein
MTALATRTNSETPIPQNPNFALDDGGMPIYLGQTEDDIGQDWDETAASIDKDHWKLAAIAATVITKYGQNNIGTFAEEHGTSSRWIRNLGNAYRTFQFGRRVPNLPISHHISALKAKNPVRAAKIAHDRHYSVKELDSWIYKGEGRNKRLERATPPSVSDQPIEITVEAEDADSEEGVTIEDEELDYEDRELLLADLQLIMRMCKTARAGIKTRFADRYVENLEQEIDWEVERLTRMPSALPERVETFIRGGCWVPAQIMVKAKIGTVGELNRICLRLEKAGKIKLSREGKRVHGTAPELWMPADMPDGGEFQIERYRPDIEYGED